MRVGLKIAPGLVGDDTTFAAAGYWADGSNIRFRMGLPETIGGWWRLTEETLTGACRAALPWRTGAFTDFLALGTNSNLYVYSGGILTDITPEEDFTPGAVNGTPGAGFGTGEYGEGGYGGTSITDYFPLTWTFANWGDQLIACPREQTLFLWQGDTGEKAAALANAPEKVTCVLVAPNRQVHAFGCTQVDGTYNPMCIRGSDLRNNAEWSPAPENNSFEVILEGGGRIVAALQIGDQELVWTTQGVHLGTNIGAPNQPYVYAPIPGSIGLIGAKAAIVVGNTAYYLGVDQQFYRYDLGGSVQPIPCPIQTEFTGNIAAAQEDKIQASYISEFNEVWWDYPDVRDGQENSRAIFLNIVDGLWSKARMPRSCRIAGQPKPIGVSPDGVIYTQESGHDADGGPLEAFIESADQYVSEDQVLRGRSVYPDLKDQVGPVRFSVVTRFKPQGDETVKGPYTLAPSSDKADFMWTGRLVRMRFESASVPSRWRLGRPIFDAVPAGTR